MIHKNNNSHGVTISSTASRYINSRVNFNCIILCYQNVNDYKMFNRCRPCKVSEA